MSSIGVPRDKQGDPQWAREWCETWRDLLCTDCLPHDVQIAELNDIDVLTIESADILDPDDPMARRCGRHYFIHEHGVGLHQQGYDAQEIVQMADSWARANGYE